MRCQAVLRGAVLIYRGPSTVLISLRPENSNDPGPLYHVLFVALIYKTVKILDNLLHDVLLPGNVGVGAEAQPLQELHLVPPHLIVV